MQSQTMPSAKKKKQQNRRGNAKGKVPPPEPSPLPTIMARAPDSDGHPLDDVRSVECGPWRLVKNESYVCPPTVGSIQDNDTHREKSHYKENLLMLPPASVVENIGRGSAWATEAVTELLAHYIPQTAH